MADKQKKPFRLFEQWGGDDKVFRLAQQIVMWVALVTIAYIIWG